MLRFNRNTRALLLVAFAATCGVEAATISAVQSPKDLVNVGDIVIVPRGCTPIYPADVVDKTYQITLPGRYCLVGMLEASRPVVKATTPSDLQSAVITLQRHTGAAIHVQASSVEIDFRGYTLNERMRGSIADGVRIDAGLSSVLVHGGKITGFTQGILSSSGIPQASDIRVRKMNIAESHTGVALSGVRDSLVTENTLAAKFMGVGLSTADHVVISRNDVTISNTLGGGIGIYTSWGVRNVSIIENVVRGRGLAGTVGIHLHNHTYRATPEELSRDSRVDGNRLYGVQEPILVIGSGIASNNAVRNNQIYGSNEQSIASTFPSSFAGRFTAIRVSNNLDIEISGNTIMSSTALAYYYGISLSASTVRLDASGRSTLRFNQTCGVADPLVPPTGVAESTIDGGSNFWNTGLCSPPVTQ